MRRARYLAGDSAPRERSIARDWMCGLAIPTRTCAPAWHAGRSTNDCGDHPTPERQYWRALSTTSTLECMTWKGERRCRNGPRIRAQLRWRDKSSAVCRASGGWFYAGIGDGTVRCRAAAFGKFRFFSIEIATAVSRIAHQTVTTCRRTLVRASSQGCVQMHTTQTVSGIGAMARKRRPLRRIVMWRDRATFPDN